MATLHSSAQSLAADATRDELPDHPVTSTVEDKIRAFTGLKSDANFLPCVIRAEECGSLEAGHGHVIHE